MVGVGARRRNMEGVWPSAMCVVTIVHFAVAVVLAVMRTVAVVHIAVAVTLVVEGTETVVMEVVTVVRLVVTVAPVLTCACRV